MVTKSVSGCCDCPFEYDAIACQCPSRAEPEDIDESDVCGDTLPIWCPLRAGPVTVELEVGT